MPSHAEMWEQIAEVAYDICTEWEIDFLESIEQRAKSNDLSPKQAAILERIYRKACGSRY